MRKAASYGIIVLVLSNLLVIALAPFVMRDERGFWASIAVQYGGSVLAAYLAARCAPERKEILAVLMATVASALWVTANVTYASNGVGTDFIGVTANVIGAVYMFGVNFVLCVGGAQWGSARARKNIKSNLIQPESSAHPLASRRRPWIWFATVVAAVASVFAGLSLLLHSRTPKANIWILPDGCVGWVVVEFGVPGAPPLPMDDGYGVIRVPVTARVQTASALVTSPSRDQFWYEREGKRIPGPRLAARWTSQNPEDVTGGTGRTTVFSFFGPNADWERMRPEGTSQPTAALVRCR